MRIYPRDDAHFEELCGRKDLFYNSIWADEIKFFTTFEEAQAESEKEQKAYSEKYQAAKKEQREKQQNWFAAKFFMVMIPLFLVGACTYNVATAETSEPNYIMNLPVQDCFPRCNR